MKVRELIAELGKLHPELDLIKADDDEGNGYTHIHGVEHTKAIEMDAYKPTAIHPDDYDAYEDATEVVLIY